MDEKYSKKTDMLTPRQFREKEDIVCKFAYSNLAYAIGVDKYNLDLFNEGKSELKDIFKEELKKYGLIVKQVDSFKELEGKTGFILYGYYPRATDFGVVYDVYHVLRINPDNTYVHYDEDWGFPVSMDIPDEKGQIGGYALCFGPLHFFELVEERNKDIDELKKRSESVFDEIQNILNNGNLSDDEKKKLKEKIKPLRAEIGDINKESFTSNYVNIILENALTIAEEYKREINPEEQGQEQGS